MKYNLLGAVSTIALGAAFGVGTPGVANSLSPLSVNDGDRVWLAADDGAIWLYRPSTGLEQVAKVTTSTQGAPGVAVSGPCA